MSKFSGTWLPTMKSTRQLLFEEACHEITCCDKLKGFKRHPIYTNFIANDVRDRVTAEAFYFYLKSKHPDLLDRYEEEFSLNDRIGLPYLYTIEKTIVSPGTLRFMKVMGDITKAIEKPKRIIEIGSGYGGQCLVAKVFDPTIDYTIVDIPKSLEVADMYLKENQIEHTSIPSTNVQVEGEFDVCISDYCLSEFDEQGVKFYIDTILSKSKMAYITTNSIGLTLKALLYMLFDNFSDIQLEREEPKTSEHSNYILICKR